MTSAHALSHYCHRLSFSEHMYVTIEYTLEPNRIQRVPKSGLCIEYDDLPIVRKDERNARMPRARVRIGPDL